MPPTSRERTAVLAARRGLSLYIHGKEVRGARADGSTMTVCRVHTVHDAWQLAEEALLRLPESSPCAPRWVLTTGTGTLAGESLWRVLMHYISHWYGGPHGR